LADPYRLLYTFVTAEDELSSYLGNGPEHTDDRPVLSYTTYGASFRTTISDNLLELLARRFDVARFVRSPVDQTKLLTHYAASNEAMLGHLALLHGDDNGALRHYVEGAKLLPQDSSLKQLVFTIYMGMQNGHKSEGF
jgi:hypothetical protein